MTDETPSTRRNVLRTGLGIAATGAVAGCTDFSGPEESSGTATPGSTESGGTATPEDETSTGDSDETENGESSGRYSVSMPPVGTVEFESVPETWVANNGSWADMGVALGREPPKAVWLTSRYPTRYYDEIPGIEVDASGMESLSDEGVDKERFYALDADVHVVDPNFLMNRFPEWDESDVSDVEQRVGPFFGNSIFSTGYEWHADYPYLSLLEAFEKLAEVFRDRERYEAFVDVHETFDSNVESIVPDDEAERPTVAIMWAAGNEPEEFSPYLIGDGTSFKQWRDLGVRDALAETGVRDFHENRGRVDYETLLRIDPEFLLFRGHENQTRQAFQDTLVTYIEDHDVASDLRAVQNGNVYRGGPLYQGPITNLVVTERAASQVYGVDEELYDRQRVADIVAGDF